MTSATGPVICDGCVHLDRTWRQRRQVDELDRCTAFPGGIPGEISLGGFDHRQPFEGDRGIRFELLPGEEDELAFYERYQRAATG